MTLEIAFTGFLLTACPGEAPPAKTIRVIHEGLRTTVACSPDGKLIATGGQDKHIRLWRVADGKLLRSFLAHAAPAGVARLAFFPDGRTIASAGWAGDGTVKLWETATGKQRRLIGCNEGGIANLAVSPDGKLVAWGNGGKVRLHDVAGNREARVLATGFAVDSTAFSPDGKVLASANGGGNVRLWDVATGKLRHDLPARQIVTSGTQAVAFAPDGNTLATVGAAVRLWNAATGKELPSLKPVATEPTELYFCVAISPKGDRLAAGGNNGVRLWDLATGKEVRRWNESARSIAFSPDGRRLAMGREGGATLVVLG